MNIAMLLHKRLSLKAAALAITRVRMARAGVTASRSRLLPALALTGSGSDSRSGLSPTDKTGGPADPLARRPDLRAAEEQLAAESERLREARTHYFPKFFLGAVFGRQELTLNAVALSPVRYANVAAAFSAPIFAGGRIHAGQIDLLQWPVLQRAALAADQALVASETQGAINTIRLHQSLGGNWDVAQASHPTPDATPDATPDTTPDTTPPVARLAPASASSSQSLVSVPSW